LTAKCSGLKWHIITGEYPPQYGGVSDYTRLVAQALAGEGDQVEIWAPPCDGVRSNDEDIRIHRLPDRFGRRSLAALQSGIRSASDTRVLVQYVPHAFGWKAMNLPLCLWLSARCRKSLYVMFHEVSYPVARDQSIRHNALGIVTRAMALMLAASAREVMISTPGWESLLRPSIRSKAKIRWTPVPSSVPVITDLAAVASIRLKLSATGRTLLGHFGTYGRWIAGPLRTIFQKILAGNEDVAVLLLGRGGEAFRERLVSEYPAFASRIHATGGLESGVLSHHISACDLFVQYYPDGVSSRRTSVMALIAHGRAVVTTCGPLTENVWRDSNAVMLAPAAEPAKLAGLVLQAIRDDAECRRIGEAARVLYYDRFDIRHTIAALRASIRS
jgi:glycosyltransferase involved in cell wall biosynthesis